MRPGCGLDSKNSWELSSPPAASGPRCGKTLPKRCRSGKSNSRTAIECSGAVKRPRNLAEAAPARDARNILHRRSMAARRNRQGKARTPKRIGRKESSYAVSIDVQIGGSSKRQVAHDENPRVARKHWRSRHLLPKKCSGGSMIGNACAFAGPGLANGSGRCRNNRYCVAIGIALINPRLTRYVTDAARPTPLQSIFTVRQFSTLDNRGGIRLIAR